MSARELPPSLEDVARELASHGVEGVYHRWLKTCGQSYLDTQITLARASRIRRWKGY